MKVSRKIVSLFFTLSPEDTAKKIEVSRDDLFFVMASMIAISIVPFLVMRLAV